MDRSKAGRLELLGRAAACITAAIPSTLMMVPLPLTLAMTRRFSREERVKQLHFMVPWARFCCQKILKISLSVEGKNHLPPRTRGHMFVSNHQSYVDIMVLMDALNTVSFLSKDLVKYIPFIGLCAYAGGTIFFNRRDHQSRQRALRETLRMCQQSTAVVVFPEGTRSFDGQLRPKIHPSAITAAYHQGLKIIPVGIDGSAKVVPKTMDRIQPGQTVAVTVGQPLDPRDFPDDPQRWVTAVWGRVSELFSQSRRRLKQERTSA